MSKTESSVLLEGNIATLYCSMSKPLEQGTSQRTRMLVFVVFADDSPGGAFGTLARKNYLAKDEIQSFLPKVCPIARDSSDVRSLHP